MLISSPWGTAQNSAPLLLVWKPDLHCLVSESATQLIPKFLLRNASFPRIAHKGKKTRFWAYFGLFCPFFYPSHPLTKNMLLKEKKNRPRCLFSLSESKKHGNLVVNHSRSTQKCGPYGCFCAKWSLSKHGFNMVISIEQLISFDLDIEIVMCIILWNIGIIRHQLLSICHYKQFWLFFSGVIPIHDRIWVH